MTYPFNFDNVLNGLLVLFIIGTFDDEVQNIIHVAINADSAQNGPNSYNYQFLTFLFLWSFIVIGVWFFLNVFVGVVFVNFRITQKSNKNSFFTEQQLQWIEMQNVLSKERPHNQRKNGENARLIKRIALKLKKSEVHSKMMIFSSIILFIVLILYDDPPFIKEYQTYLDGLTLILAAIYFYEMTINMIYYGFLEYFSEEKHISQFLITMIYLLSTFLIYLNLEGLDRKYISLLSLMKVVGLFRVLERLKGLKRLLITLRFHSHNIKNILFLFLLTLTFYTVIGCYLFKEVREGKIINDYVNFKNFLYGMMTLVRCFTANSWPNIMNDTSKYGDDCQKGVDCGSRYAPIFFISFMFVFQMILSNLLILVLLEEFEYFSKHPKNPVLIFYQNLESFKKLWAEFSLKKRMKIHNLFEFLKMLGPPLGLRKGDGFLKLGAKIKKMVIVTDSKEFLSFHHLLHALMKNYVLDELLSKENDENKEKAKKKLKKREQKFFRSLWQKKEKIKQIFFHKKYEEENNKVKFYPFRSLLYCHMAFNFWMKFAEKSNKCRKNLYLDKKSSKRMEQKTIHKETTGFFKLNKMEVSIYKQKKQSVIMEQEEENEERKANHIIILKGKRKTMNKVNPVSQNRRKKTSY